MRSKAGSPQWQIEAFCRIEIPTDVQERHDFEPLEPANSAVKNAIFGINPAGQYGIELDTNGRPIENYQNDELSGLIGEYLGADNQPGNLYWG